MTGPARTHESRVVERHFRGHARGIAENLQD
jgi:hypothetical protein